MGTACEEGYCDCTFHRPNMKHNAECDCLDCVKRYRDPMVVWTKDSLQQAVNRAVITTLNEYQRFAGVTANAKLDGKLNLATLGLGIAGEAGEVADLIKKHVGHDHDLDNDKLIKEIGDVLWYAAVLSNAVGVPLQTVAQRNIDKLRARYPEGFSVEASKNRKPGDV